MRVWKIEKYKFEGLGPNSNYSKFSQMYSEKHLKLQIHGTILLFSCAFFKNTKGNLTVAKGSLLVFLKIHISNLN